MIEQILFLILMLLTGVVLVLYTRLRGAKLDREMGITRED